MRLFGDVLPFIGFRRIESHELYELDLDPIPDGYWQSFELEWFGMGMVVAVWPVNNRSEEA